MKVPSVRTTALLLCGLLLPGCGGTPGVTLANYDRVQKGMTMDEVRAILGPPRSSRYADGTGSVEDSKPGVSSPKPGRQYTWQWYTQHKHLESLDILVTFDDDKVVSKEKGTSAIDPR
jgi:hypothetical protein